jgi:gliding motility-associated-like protein
MISGNAVINTSDLVIQNGATVTNAGPNSYVDGALFIDLTSLSGGSVTYPIGTGGEYLPIDLQGIDALGVHGFEVIDSPLNGDDNFTNLAPRHWERIATNNSTFNASNVTLPLIGDEQFDTNDLTIVEANSRNENVIAVLSNYQGGNTISSTDPVTQRFISIAEVGIPLIATNVITPNGDLYNDILYIENIDQFPDNQVQIINRWGIEVFNESGYDNTNVFWDGTVDNKIAPPGNYIAVIKTSQKTIKQTITIIR